MNHRGFTNPKNREERLHNALTVILIQIEQIQAKGQPDFGWHEWLRSTSGQIQQALEWTPQNNEQTPPQTT